MKYLFLSLIINIVPFRKLRAKFRKYKCVNLKKLNKRFMKGNGYKLNLLEPKSFNEKIQWYKLFYSHPLISRCSDKYAVRVFYEENGFANHLVPLFGRWDSFDDINWDLIPTKFVIKTNHSSGDVWLVEDKNQLDKAKLKREITEALNHTYGVSNGEFFYSFIKPSILIEKMLSDPVSLMDYKVYCFQGKAEYIQVDIDRQRNHTYRIYDVNWKYTDCGNTDKDIPKPNKLKEMLSIANKLARDFSHVRVDMFYVDDEIYLGEMTFATGSGFVPFDPVEWDYIFGEKWDLSSIDPKYKRKKPCLHIWDY